MSRSFFSPLGISLCMTLGWGMAAASAQDASPAPEVTRNPQIGVNTHFAQHWDLNAVLPLVSQSGIGWIRDELYWNTVEKEKGAYQIPEKSLRWINAAHAAGLNIIVIFNGGNDLYKPDIYDREAYAKAAAFVANDLAGKVQAIEILNEPANFGFSKHYGGVWNGLEKDGSISPWVPKYVDLLNASAKAIKAVNPNVKVIGLGSATPVNYRQLEMGIAPEVDGITDHPYSYRLPGEVLPFAGKDGILNRDGIAVADERGSFASLIRMYREKSLKTKGPKEIWLTEWGWTTYQEVIPTLYAGFTRSAQAKYTLRRLTESLGLGVDVSVIYDFKDDGGDPYESEQNFGLIDSELQPKPAYGAVQRLAAAMAGFRPSKNFKINIFQVGSRPDRHPIVWDGSKIEAGDNILCYQFSDNDGNPLIALWSGERADSDLSPRVADVELETGGLTIEEVRSYSPLSGVSATIPFESGTAGAIMKKLEIPDSPLLLTVRLAKP